MVRIPKAKRPVCFKVYFNSISGIFISKKIHSSAGVAMELVFFWLHVMLRNKFNWPLPDYVVYINGSHLSR